MDRTNTITEPRPALPLRGDAHDGATEAHASQHDLPHDLPKIGSGAIVLVAIAVVVLFAILFVVGFIPHRHRLAEADRIAAEQNQRPIVDVVKPKHSQGGFDIVLPGDARAFQQTSIFPRANGYLKKLLVDIGDRVHEGQLLAEIDTPEVDAQLNEAKATFEQVKTSVTKAESDLDLAQTTLKRFEEASAGAVTQLDLDEKRAAVRQAKATLESAKANVVASQAAVQRLTETQGFDKVTAPFSGVISARNFDVGPLLNPANSAAGSELFRLDQTNVLRVFISVPQPYATSIKSDAPADFLVNNFPGRVFKGKVARSAGTIDPATRTQRYEVDVDNADLILLAGMYGQVRLTIIQDHPPLIVPTSAMIFDPDGTKVAIVNNGKAHFQKVTLGRDFGTELEILEGLSGDEQIVKNPSQRVTEGVEVQIATSPAVAPNGPIQREANAK